MPNSIPTIRTNLRAAAALITAVALLLTMAAVPSEAAKGSKRQSAKVIRWSDGDTVVTNRGTVRLIGIDAPERGMCGSKKASRIARRLAPSGTRIRLVNPSSVQNKDTYGRKLRFVQAGRVDVGLRQIQKGAKARYDGGDGFDKHPRQGKYRRSDRNNRDHCKRKGGDNQGSNGGGDNASHAPVPGTWNCPKNAPIKGNRGESEWIYHLPSQQYYQATNPEECFATEAGARKAGYRKSKI